MRSVLDVNNVSEERYKTFIGCVLEIDNRIRSSKEKDRPVSSSSTQINNENSTNNGQQGTFNGAVTNTIGK